MPDTPLGQDANEPKTGAWKGLAVFAAFLGIVLVFVFFLAAIIKWVAA